ncbi:MAG: DUF1131 family protein [Cocleimonas sp.]|nr:DUF1131 family protein [Cocleimonas sp.]
MHKQHGLLFSWLFTKLSIILIATTLLTACGSDDGKLKKVAATEDKTIVLSAGGIGPINATTSFNMHQMTLAFSDFNVVEELNYRSGSPFPVIRISEGVKTVMTIIPDGSQQNIFSIIVEDNLIVNSLGHHLGSNYSEVYTYGQNEECQAGSDDLLGKVICYAPKAPNILYVFNGKWDGELGKVPTADILQGWGLESIIWRPK